MKTWKQKYQELECHYKNFRSSVSKIYNENELRKKELEENNLSDPVLYKQSFEKLVVCIKGLNAIRSISTPGSNEWIIAKEVLHQIKEVNANTSN